jgi:hypothetical protein
VNQREQEKKKNEKLEAYIVSLIRDLQKRNTRENNTKVLEQIIGSQRLHHDRIILGYKKNKNEEGFSSKEEECEEEHKCYT